MEEDFRRHSEEGRCIAVPVLRELQEAQNQNVSDEASRRKCISAVRRSIAGNNRNNNRGWWLYRFSIGMEAGHSVQIITPLLAERRKRFTSEEAILRSFRFLLWEAMQASVSYNAADLIKVFITLQGGGSHGTDTQP